jgi:hypothetical protein
VARAGDARGGRPIGAHRDIEGLIGAPGKSSSADDFDRDIGPSPYELEAQERERQAALRREYRAQERRRVREQNSPPAAGSPGPQAPPRARRDRVRRSASARRPSSSGRRRRSRRPTLADPTGGRVPLLSFDGEGLGGLFIGAVAYALLLSVVNYGPKGPGLWFKAKFLNQAAGSTSSGTATATAAPASGSTPITLA